MIHRDQTGLWLTVSISLSAHLSVCLLLAVELYSRFSSVPARILSVRLASGCHTHSSRRLLLLLLVHCCNLTLLIADLASPYLTRWHVHLTVSLFTVREPASLLLLLLLLLMMMFCLQRD